jgi:hypothetical protein
VYRLLVLSPFFNLVFDSILLYDFTKSVTLFGICWGINIDRVLNPRLLLVGVAPLECRHDETKA